MSVTFTSVRCPECGANLPIEEGRTQMFCSYCGTKILVNNENEYIYRHIDEAGIKRAETDRIIRMRELELAEKKNTNKRMITIVWLSATVILLIVSIVMMIHPDPDMGITGMLLLEVAVGLAIGGGILVFKILPEKEAERILIQNGGIRFPKDLEPYTEKNFEIIMSALRSAGFTNITCINLHDLTFGISRKAGKIEKISVNGKEITSGGKVYLPSVPITIIYHGK